MYTQDTHHNAVRMVHTDTRIHACVHTLKLFSKVAASVLFTLCTEVRQSIACGCEEGESRRG